MTCYARLAQRAAEAGEPHPLLPARAYVSVSEFCWYVHLPEAGAFRVLNRRSA